MPTSLFRALSTLLATLVIGCSSQAPTPGTTTLPADTPAPPTAAGTAQVTPTIGSTDSPGPTAPPSQAPSPSATATPAEPTPTIDGPMAGHYEDEMSRVAQRAFGRFEIPGMTVDVIFPDETEWLGGFGKADVERDIAAGPNVPFSAGSVSKTFVAATILQLAEEGRLSLGDPLSNWLPDYPRADRITLQHLLSHTSGVFNYFEDPDYNQLVFQTQVGRNWEPSEILAEFGGDAYCDPGACFHYSNTGFILLGLVIEQITGDRLESVLADRFFEPLGMVDTYFQDEEPPPPGTAVGYLERQVGLRPIDDGTDYRPTISAATVAWAAGAVVSTAPDLARWVRALYGGDILSAESLDLMIVNDYSPRNNEIYGLGTRSRFFGDAQMFGHTGSLRGFYAAAWHMPGEDLTIVVMTNLGRIDPNLIVDELADVVLD